MHLCVFEDDQADHLRPLAATRAVYNLRLGMRTLLGNTRLAFNNPSIYLHARGQVASITCEENNLPTNQLPAEADILLSMAASSPKKVRS